MDIILYKHIFMDALTTLDLLYIALTVFVSVIGVLLAILLYKVIKILSPVQDLTSKYYDVKGYVNQFNELPDMVKDKVMGFIGK
ncbi:hypothetical protein OAN96_00375 [Candidatus Gracilibacteria bacterium]|nr:hypothetical protein [Candidatus Gracilibacteria bacterium]